MSRWQPTLVFAVLATTLLAGASGRGEVHAGTPSCPDPEPVACAKHILKSRSRPFQAAMTIASVVSLELMPVRRPPAYLSSYIYGPGGAIPQAYRFSQDGRHLCHGSAPCTANNDLLVFSPDHGAICDGESASPCSPRTALFVRSADKKLLCQAGKACKPARAFASRSRDLMCLGAPCTSKNATIRVSEDRRTICGYRDEELDNQCPALFENNRIFTTRQ